MSLRWPSRTAARLLFGGIVIASALLTTLTGWMETPNRFFYDQILNHSSAEEFYHYFEANQGIAPVLEAAHVDP